MGSDDSFLKRLQATADGVETVQDRLGIYPKGEGKGPRGPQDNNDRVGVRPSRASRIAASQPTRGGRR